MANRTHYVFNNHPTEDDAARAGERGDLIVMRIPFLEGRNHAAILMDRVRAAGGHVEVAENGATSGGDVSWFAAYVDDLFSDNREFESWFHGATARGLDLSGHKSLSHTIGLVPLDNSTSVEEIEAGSVLDGDDDFPDGGVLDGDDCLGCH